ASLSRAPREGAYRGRERLWPCDDGDRRDRAARSLGGLEASDSAPVRGRCTMNDFFALLPLFSIAAFGLLLLVVEAFAKERLDWEILTGSIFGVALFAAIGALFAPVDASGVSESITRYLSVDRGAFLSDALIALGGLITALA